MSDVFRPDTWPAHFDGEMEVKAFRIACGEFISTSDVEQEELEKEGTAQIPKGFPRENHLFTARARGDSMEPKIENGAWCIFRPNPVGTRQDRIVLVEDQSKIGVDRYTLKKYHSTKTHFQDGSPILLETDGDYRICGWYIGCVLQIQRVEKIRYENVDED